MAYYRAYLKRYRGKRFRSRKFSKFSTYKNRSSKAQANQIYSLNKKINKISKLTKPEYREFFMKRQTDLISPSSLWYDQTYNCFNKDDTTFLVKTPASITGNSIRMIKLIIWGSLTRIPDSQATQQYDEGPYDLFLTGDQPFLMRILVGILPQARTNIPVASQLMETDNQWSIDNFKAPLLKGAGSLLKILKVKRYSFNLSNQTTKTFKFTIPLYGQIARRVDGEYYVQGQPLIYVSSLNNQFTNKFSSDVSFSINSKLIYVDA